MHSNRFVVSTLLPVLLLSLSGCFGTTPPAQFYLLEPIGDAGGQVIPAATGTKPLVALAPVHVPEYVDRPQIVTATGKNAYRLAEFDRWAEPLNDNITRVLQQDMAALVPADVVLSNTSPRAKQAQFRVSVNILEFHVDPQDQARLVTQWQILRGEKTIAGRLSSYRTPAAHDDYSAGVAALNVCLQNLSRDLAAELRQAAARP